MAYTGAGKRCGGCRDAASSGQSGEKDGNLDSRLQWWNFFRLHIWDFTQTAACSNACMQVNQSPTALVWRHKMLNCAITVGIIAEYHSDADHRWKWEQSVRIFMMKRSRRFHDASLSVRCCFITRAAICQRVKLRHPVLDPQTAARVIAASRDSPNEIWIINKSQPQLSLFFLGGGWTLKLGWWSSRGTCVILKYGFDCFYFAGLMKAARRFGGISP